MSDGVFGWVLCGILAVFFIVWAIVSSNSRYDFMFNECMKDGTHPSAYCKEIAFDATWGRLL